MSDQAPSFDRLTLSQLRESCKRRGLESTGIRKVLLARLKEHAESDDKEVKIEEDMEEGVEVKEEPKEDVQTDEAEKEKKKDKETEVTKSGDKEKSEKDANCIPSDILSDGKPKNVGRQKFSFGYMKMLSMKSVVIYPFKPEIFNNPVFAEHRDKAVSYIIKNTNQSKTSAVILEFATVNAGDEAWREIHEALSDDEELTIEHPDFHGKAANENSLSSFWNSHIDTSLDWFLNMCVLKNDEFQDLFAKRVLLMENVPECTQDELVEAFPEAHTITYLAFDPECPGCVGVECFSKEDAEKFIKKYHGHNFKGVNVSVEWYNVRFKRFERVVRRYRTQHPETGPGAIVYSSLTDEERMEKVKEFKALNEAKPAIEQSYEYSGFEKIRKCQELSNTQIPIARHLFQDAKRRHEQGKAIPEPTEDQTYMVKNLLTGRLHKRRENAEKGLKLLAANKEKEEKVKKLQKVKPLLSQAGSQNKQAGKRPAGSGQNLSGHPPHKKFQGKSPRGQMQNRYGNDSPMNMNRGMRGGFMGGNMGRQGGFNIRGSGMGGGFNDNRGMDGGSMGGGFNENRGMGGGFNDNRGMGGGFMEDRIMDGGGMGGGFNENRSMGGGFTENRGMGGGFNENRVMGGGFNDMDMGGSRGMGMMSPRGSMGGGKGGDRMDQVTETVKALTDKVRELEALNSRGSSGGMGSGSRGMGGGMGMGGEDGMGGGGGMGMGMTGGMGMGGGGGMGGARGTGGVRSLLANDMGMGGGDFMGGGSSMGRSMRSEMGGGMGSGFNQGMRGPGGNQGRRY